jgi:SAM-dependent methyltransferase
MGANVTSVDISEQQLNVARHRATELGLNVTFVHADVVDLSALRDETYDVVYTGGHVAVWVSDLRRYYGEAARILKRDGRLIVSEYHPFRQVWKKPSTHLDVGFNYFDRGPHRSEVAADVLYLTPGELEQFEFHWTVADYITAIVSSGCQLIHAEEFGDTSETWERAPLPSTATLLPAISLNHLSSAACSVSVGSRWQFFQMPRVSAWCAQDAEPASQRRRLTS